MAKRPTPKKRRAKSKGRNQHSVFQQKEIRRLTNRSNSPFAIAAEPKTGRGAVTRIKA